MSYSEKKLPSSDVIEGQMTEVKGVGKEEHSSSKIKKKKTEEDIRS